MSNIENYYIYAGIYLTFIFILSAILTKYILTYSLSHNLIDNPGERSSHLKPTPRGGGLSISIIILFTVVLCAVLKIMAFRDASALLFGGVLISLVGWIDDHKDISAAWRGFLYFIAACLAMIILGGFNNIKIGTTTIQLGYIGSILAIIGITWLTNLYNFMDGTDGLASLQAITASCVAGLMFWSNEEYGMAIVCLSVTSACAGFLVWNWPPAKIFMGDVGSCMLGFTFGICAVIGEKTESVYLYLWISLLSVFIMDATLTLIKRIITGEKWYIAHRTHGYQKLIQLGMSHSDLAISFIILNIFLILPFSYVAYHWKNLSTYMILSNMLLILLLWSFIQYKYHMLNKHKIMVDN